MHVKSNWNSAGQFCHLLSNFQMKLVGFMSTVIKRLLVELIGQ